MRWCDGWKLYADHVRTNTLRFGGSLIPFLGWPLLDMSAGSYCRVVHFTAKYCGTFLHPPKACRRTRQPIDDSSKSRANALDGIHHIVDTGCTYLPGPSLRVTCDSTSLFFLFLRSRLGVKELGLQKYTKFDIFWIFDKKPSQVMVKESRVTHGKSLKVQLDN
ncbi:hypothetical protein K439DRAFT_327074 [Ramaria rubella]|nr:hypothetical protein K439DRAFT_327074 [Ramaria rubella]